MHAFVFDDVHSDDYGVYVVASNVFDSAEEDVESVEIPYSNRVVHLSKGSFKPFTIKNECLIYEDAFARLDGFKNFLQSRGKACRYVDLLMPDEFRIARFKRAFEVRRTDYDNVAVFDLEFEAMPQRFLTSGEEPILIVAQSTETIANIQSFESKPLIAIHKTGNCTIGDYSITVNSGVLGGTPVYIDCETMQCYQFGPTVVGEPPRKINANNLVELPNGFPVLKVGNSEIANGTSGVIEITPRWWKI